MKKIPFISLILLAALTSCHNQDWEFPDYEYQTVYFAYQYPVRTITLGEDIFDTSLDNAHKCSIMATTGGVYSTKNEVVIDVEVDNTIIGDGFLFATGGSDIIAMPANYYTLASNKIIIPTGKLSGGVEVQLTDAFFADSLAIKKTYVIPLVMTNVVNADSILSGKPLIDNPNRCISSNWAIVPKDYILYTIKYVNPWHGFYLRRGKDVVTGKNGNTALDSTIVRHKQYVEKDEVCSTNTRSMDKVEFPLTFKDSKGITVNCILILTVNSSGDIIVSSNSTTYTASGTGTFVKKGEKNSWGNTDRDAIYLNYSIDFTDRTIATKDTLVLRNRGVVMETFTPVLK